MHPYSSYKKASSMIIDARSDTFSDAGGAIQWWADQP
jgi:hypothetical protein